MGPNETKTQSPHYLVRLVILFALYFGTAKLGLSLGAVSGFATAVWPPSGIALVALSLFGYRLWPGIALGAFLVNALAGAPLLIAGGMAAGNTLEAVLGVYLLRRVVAFRPSLDRLQDVIGLVALAAVVSTTVSATIGVTTGWLGGVIPASHAGRALWTWWLGDMMGDLLFAPLLFVWSGQTRGRMPPRQVPEAWALLLPVVAVALLVFGDLSDTQLTRSPYVLFPFLIWAALRFGPRGAATATCVMSAIAIWGTARGHGPFVSQNLGESLLMLQTFMGVAAVTVLILAADVTERKRVEGALGASEARLAGIIGSATEAMITVNEAQRIIVFNAAAEQMYGLPAPEMLGQPLDRLLPEPYRRGHREHILAFGRTGVTSRSMQSPGTLTAVRADGEEFPIEATISQVVVSGQKLFTVMMHDITERQQAETALRESEERFRATFEQAAVGIAHIAPDGHWLRMNQRLCDIVGYTREELLQRTFQDITHPDDLQADLEHVNQVLAGTVQTYTMEKRYFRKDGTVVWINLTVSLVRDPLGTPKYFISVVEDITARKHAEEQMRRWAEELVEADRRKDEFISMLGHELRNPLAGIVTAGHALRAHADDVATIQRAHDMIEQKSRHMARLVDDLLDVSRITHGKIEIDRECLDLNDLVGAWGREHRSLLEQEGISLIVELPGEAVWIDGDETRLIQVMENLLHNAGKFTGAGGRVTVRLTVDTCRNRAAVQVIDTGTGIEPELLPHLFEPFIQGDHSLDRRLGGLGVGLTLVKHLIELHGGEVAVHSEGSGRGSEFSFTLPLSRFEVNSRSSKAAASPTPAGFGSTGSACRAPGRCEL